MLHKDLTGNNLHVNKLHADTHVAAGTDPLVLAESQITDLVTDLAAKSSQVMFNVKDYGAYGDNSHDDTAAINATMAAIGTTNSIMYFPNGTYLTTGIFLNGRALSIRGDGMGSVIKGKTGITGAVIDFSGYLSGDSLGLGRAWTSRCFRDFRLQGDDVAGAGHYGIYMNPAYPVVSLSFRDITVSKMGDSGVYMENAIFCNFTNVTVCDDHSTPLWILTGWTNSNVFINCGLLTSGVMGNATGALILQADTAGTWYPHQNVFISCWSEALRLPENSSVIYDASHQNTFDNFYAWDTTTVDANNDPITTTINTCAIRLAACDSPGGNEVRGVIQGRRSAVEFHWGIIVSQNGNLISGTKEGGYSANLSHLVLLTSGCRYNFIQLAGSQLGAETCAGIVDDSGMTTNTLIDPGGGRPSGNTISSSLVAPLNNLDTGVANEIRVTQDAMYVCAPQRTVPSPWVIGTGSSAPYCNLLTANQSNAETDTTGMAANGTLTRNTSTPIAETGDFKVVATADGNLDLYQSSRMVVTAGLTYCGQATIKTSGCAGGRQCLTLIAWYNAVGANFATSIGSVIDAPTTDTFVSQISVAPVGAVTAVLYVRIVSAVIGEILEADSLMIEFLPLTEWKKVALEAF